MSAVITKTYPAPPLCEKDALRYAGCLVEDEATVDLLRACWLEAADAFTYKVCYGVFPLLVQEDVCAVSTFSWTSHDLAATLAGCECAVVFAATVGVSLDRLIAKYGRVAPARALMLQALGAERIEALCDVFCADLAREMAAGMTTRFSPGYGDLPLAAQQEIFALLDPARRIGLSLNGSLLMSPSKSVTAVVGIRKN